MFLQTAIEAARLGGQILLDNLESKMRHQISRKQEFDYVTQVDFLAENAILKFLKQRHPAHDVLAEESGKQDGSSAFEWIIDPLDGTKNYIHGIPIFAVSVALRYQNEIQAGAIFDPTRDELFHAEKGKGAFLNNQAIHVSKSHRLRECLIATGFPFRAKRYSKAYFRALSAVFHQVSDLRRAGSAALDLASVACGRLDGFWEINLNIWDIAAGVLLIKEAGGHVTSITGQENYLKTGHIVTSNGLIHNRLLELVCEPFVDTDL